MRKMSNGFLYKSRAISVGCFSWRCASSIELWEGERLAFVKICVIFELRRTKCAFKPPVGKSRSFAKFASGKTYEKLKSPNPKIR